MQEALDVFPPEAHDLAVGTIVVATLVGFITKRSGARWQHSIATEHRRTAQASADLRAAESNAYRPRASHPTPSAIAPSFEQPAAADNETSACVAMDAEQQADVIEATLARLRTSIVGAKPPSLPTQAPSPHVLSLASTSPQSPVAPSPQSGQAPMPMLHVNVPSPLRLASLESLEGLAAQYDDSAPLLHSEVLLSDEEASAARSELLDAGLRRALDQSDTATGGHAFA